MQNKGFIEICKQLVVDYFNGIKESRDKNGLITQNDVFVVWLCKTLQDNKALLSTTVPDGMYYEITFNGDMNEIYLDVYKKWQNKCFELEDIPFV